MTHRRRGRIAQEVRRDGALGRRVQQLARYNSGDYMTYPHDRDGERLVPSQSVIGAKSAKRRRQRKKNIAEEEINNLRAKMKGYT